MQPERWRTVVSSEVLAAPAVTRDLVLVRTVDGKLIALDVDTGGEAWFVQQSVPRLSVRGTGAPVVMRDAVVCGFDNGRIAAFGFYLPGQNARNRSEVQIDDARNSPRLCTPERIARHTRRIGIHVFEVFTDRF